MEPTSMVCDICGRSYELQPVTFESFGNSQVYMDSSAVLIKLARPIKPRRYMYHVCSHCAEKIMKSIIDIQRKRPKKCEFCEFERGPLMSKPAECTACTRYNHFQVKKRMSPRQNYEWSMYMGYLEGEKT